MPYVVRKQKGKRCVYKKKKNGKPGEKVGCTKKSIKKYLAALHINANESLEEKTMKISKQKLERIIKEEVAREMRMRKRLSEAMSDYDREADASYVDYQKTGSELTNLGQQIAAAFEKDRQNPDLEFLTLRGSEAVELLGSGPDNDAGAKSNFVDVMAGAGVDPKQTRMILAVMKELKHNEYN